MTDFDTSNGFDDDEFETAGVSDLDLETALRELIEDNDGLLGKVGAQIVDVDSFENEGVLTYNKGLVIRLENGQLFQLTIAS